MVKIFNKTLLVSVGRYCTDVYFKYFNIYKSKLGQRKFEAIYIQVVGRIIETAYMYI